MAEIFGVVASSIAVAEVASKVGGVVPRLKRLWNEIQNVPDTINDLMKQIDILDPVIWEMETEINERRASINPMLFNDSALRKSTEYCRVAVSDLTHLVDELNTRVDTERKLKRRLGKLKVVLKAQTIADYERRLGKAVSILNLAQQSYLTYEPAC
ncbi:hypothetical protein SLS62_000376 [Diatrype stigma]|uniref:Uncharacterized protein n=1 Tax=Diatrype stigma TaxID=117547 RepID=A0AAN9VA49_9PEZI